MTPITPCRHPTRPQPPTPHVAIWITDFMLRRAIEQYQRRFITSCRCLSSHKGPLESLRKLGKRHMTAIMASPSTYRSPWYFEVIGNQKEWKWEPPTTPASRKEKEGNITLSSSIDRLFQWLEDSDLDKPFLRPPDDNIQPADIHKTTDKSSIPQSVVSLEPAGFLKPVDIFQTNDQSLVSQPAVNLSSAEVLQPAINPQTADILQPTVQPSLYQQVTNLRRVIHNMNENEFTREALINLSNEFGQAVSLIIRLGELPLQDLHLAMEPLTNITQRRFPNMTSFRNFNFGIQRFIRSTVADMRKDDPEGLFLKAWKVVSVHIPLEPDIMHCRSFRHMVEVASVEDREHIPRKDLLMVVQSFLVIQATLKWNSSGHFNWLQSHARFSETIDLLEAAHGESIADEMKDFVQHESHEVQYSWLLIKAHSRNLSPDSFEAALWEYITRSRPLTTTEAWQITTARLLSAQILGRIDHRNLLQKPFASWGQRWLDVAELLAPDAIKEMCRIAYLTDTSAVLGNAVIASCLDDESPDSLRVLEAMITHPRIKHSIIRDAILREEKRLISNGSRSRVEVETRIEAMVKMLDKMAQLYLSAPDLRPRQALRGIEMCLKTQIFLAKTAREPLIAFAKMVVRDLEKGEFGRTSRLVYLINTTTRFSSPDDGRKVFSTAKKWRRLIWELSKWEGSKKYCAPTLPPRGKDQTRAGQKHWDDISSGLFD